MPASRGGTSHAQHSWTELLTINGITFAFNFAPPPWCTCRFSLPSVRLRCLLLLPSAFVCQSEVLCSALPAVHSVGGMPTCRLCGHAFSRWTSLQVHINAGQCSQLPFLNCTNETSSSLKGRTAHAEVPTPSITSVPGKPTETLLLPNPAVERETPPRRFRPCRIESCPVRTPHRRTRPYLHLILGAAC